MLQQKKKIGLVDTTYSRINMSDFAIDELKRFSNANNWAIEIIRRTVPGHKDLAVESKILLEDFKCDICIVFGWVGKKESDSMSAHEAALSINLVKILTKKHILEIMIHENDCEENDLHSIALARSVEHSRNALKMLFINDGLLKEAGTGNREGSAPATQIFKKINY